ncbi:MAG: hypothetical protein U0841_23795 [Chloroflexia bacterium]
MRLTSQIEELAIERSPTHDGDLPASVHEGVTWRCSGSSTRCGSSCTR